jgi:protein-tyrosine phosphatase
VIDLHSHILPGVDDGAPTLEVSLAMARMAVADGITHMACTPHFLPGVYDNEATDMSRRTQHFIRDLGNAGIPLSIVEGADAHIRPDFVDCLRSGRIPTLNRGRYVLFEPPHDILPQRLDDLLHNILVAGYVPVLTHPERLRWIEKHYVFVKELALTGVWMQITAGSLAGRFGKRPHYWAQRMLAEGLVRILATDAHNVTSRPPLLAEAARVAEAELGLEEAENLVVLRPQCIIENAPVEASPPLPAPKRRQAAPTEPLWRRLFMGGS